MPRARNGSMRSSRKGKTSFGFCVAAANTDHRSITCAQRCKKLPSLTIFFLQYTVPQLPPTGAGRFIRQFARTCISIQECPIVHSPPGTKMVSGTINLLVVSCTGSATTDRSRKKGHESISEDLPPLLFLSISSSIKRPGPRKGEGGPSQALVKVGKRPAAKK